MKMRGEERGGEERRGEQRRGEPSSPLLSSPFSPSPPLPSPPFTQLILSLPYSFFSMLLHPYFSYPYSSPSSLSSLAAHRSLCHYISEPIYVAPCRKTDD